MSNEVSVTEQETAAQQETAEAVSAAAAEAPDNHEAAAEGLETETPAADEDDFEWKDLINIVLNFLSKWGWALLLAFSVLLIGYFTLFPSRTEFHSDSTDTLMWAVASRDSGKLFNTDFHYACLLPFGTSMIMYALIPLFGVSMTTHVLGMLIFFLLFTAALIWMLREMKWSWGWISGAVFVELMICSGSEKLREIYWGHTIYYSLAVLFQFVGLAILFRCLDSYKKLDSAKTEETQKYSRIALYVMMGLLGLWFTLTGMNQIITIATFSLPMIGALFCERWLDHSTELHSQKNLRALTLIGIMAGGMVLGFLITKGAAKDIVAGYEGAFSNYDTMDSWVEHIEGFGKAWMTLLGVDMRDGEKLMSAKSVGWLLTFFTGIILLAVPVIALFCYNKMKDRKLRLLVLSYWLMTLLIMVGYILGKLSSANWRLAPIVGMSAVVTFAFFRWAAGEVKWQRFISLLMIPVLMVCTITSFTILKMKPDNTGENHLYRIARGLEAQGLTYGFATFWNANGATVAADSKVQLRNVTIEEGRCYPYRYQTLDKWYDAQPGQDRYFILMDAGERDMLAGSVLDECKVGETTVEGYQVWIYTEVPPFN